MTYVPIVPHTPTPPSPRARALGDQLARVMVEFEETHPTVTKGEIRQAAQLALRSRGSSDAGIVPVILGLVLLLGLVGFYVVASG